METQCCHSCNWCFSRKSNYNVKEICWHHENIVEIEHIENWGITFCPKRIGSLFHTLWSGHDSSHQACQNLFQNVIWMENQIWEIDAQACTVMNRSMNHQKWKYITANVICYSTSCILIYFTDRYLGYAAQKFQASSCTFTWGRHKTALRPTFEPKQVNESHCKKCYKCVYFVQLCPFLCYMIYLGIAERMLGIL
jgi:hypothetical protein